MVKKENRIIKREMENGDTSSLSFKNCKKKWEECILAYRFHMSNGLQFYHRGKSSFSKCQNFALHLLVDCLLSFWNSIVLHNLRIAQKLCTFASKLFLLRSKSFGGDFISTYVRSLWIKNRTWVKLTKSSLNRHWCFKSSHCY